jgi:SAM-dependent methyltransferase
MGETTTGMRAVLSHPSVYELWSRVVGGRHARSTLIGEYIRPKSGSRILDLGCGPGELLSHLPDSVSYLGVDVSREYIGRAQERFAERAEFRVGDATAVDNDLRDFDLVTAFGVLHHLDDAGAQDLFRGAANALAPAGRVVTVDPTFAEGQSRIARAIISRDRGQHVRTVDTYAALANEFFSEVVPVVPTNILRIPYTHCILECRYPHGYGKS